MEWKKFVKREHKDLEKIMKRELNFFRNQDIDFYNILESNYEDLKHSLFKNDNCLVAFSPSDGYGDSSIA